MTELLGDHQTYQNHPNLNFTIFHRVVGARKKIYSSNYYLGFLKICTNFNNPAEIVLNNVHIAQWSIALGSLLIIIINSVSQKALTNFNGLACVIDSPFLKCVLKPILMR